MSSCHRRALGFALSLVLGVGAVSAGPVAPSGAAPASGAHPAAAAHNTGNIVWSVEPVTRPGEHPRGRFALTAGPGTTATDTVRVQNRSDQDLALRLYVADAFNTETGSMDYRGADDRRVDVAAWAHLDEAGLILPPGEHADVALSVVVPRNARPGDHTAAVVAALDGPVTSTDGHRLEIERRVTTPLEVRVAGPVVARLHLEDLRLSFDRPTNPLGAGWLTLSYVVRNTGNVRLAARQDVSARGLFGQAVSRHDVDDVPELLPGGSVERIVDVGRARALTRLSAEVRLRPFRPVRPGGGPGAPTTPAPSDIRQVRSSRTVWAVPWLLVGVVLVALAIGAVIVVSRRRRASRSAARPDARSGSAPGRSGGGAQAVASGGRAGLHLTVSPDRGVRGRNEGNGGTDASPRRP